MLLGTFSVNVWQSSSVWLLGLAAIIGLVTGTYYRRAIPYIVLCLGALLIGAGFSQMQHHSDRSSTDLLALRTGYFTREVAIEGVIREKMTENRGVTSYILSDVSIDHDRLGTRIRLLGRFSRTHGLNIGDRIESSGRITQPSSSIDGFDYGKYLRLSDVYGIVSIGQYRTIGDDETNPIIRFVRTVRDRVLVTVDSIYPGESAALLQGILIGERTGLSKETRDDFARS